MLRNFVTEIAKQPCQRDVGSAISCICADGTAIPPGLIYQWDQDVWLDESDFDTSSELAYFAVSKKKKGWTSEELGMAWLTKILPPTAMVGLQ